MQLNTKRLEPLVANTLHAVCVHTSPKARAVGQLTPSLVDNPCVQAAWNAVTGRCACPQRPYSQHYAACKQSAV